MCTATCVPSIGTSRQTVSVNTMAGAVLRWMVGHYDTAIYY